MRGEAATVLAASKASIKQIWKHPKSRSSMPQYTPTGSGGSCSVKASFKFHGLKQCRESNRYGRYFRPLNVEASNLCDAGMTEYNPIKSVGCKRG
jgi:hypothetical protein